MPWLLQHPPGIDHVVVHKRWLLDGTKFELPMVPELKIHEFKFKCMFPSEVKLWSHLRGGNFMHGAAYAYPSKEVEIEAKALRVWKAVGVATVELRKKKTCKIMAQGRHTKYLALATKI
ncbi:hypothetical protein L3X38_022313 [Prunus dulcis]|uniref:Uncharacterized protein n=1 Tax=Prunus dulcis TaxID=3755 RepID=A0AAD4Z4G9_PRUDU|nr:hypothetical protein L3X38_022313 [Prunus dulcis]